MKEGEKMARSKSMKFAILGKKLGMIQYFDQDGKVVPCTAVRIDTKVIQKKTPETDGYWAVQLGSDDKKKSRVLKPEAGHFAKAKSPVKRFVKELRLDETSAAKWEVGMEIKASVLQPGDKVDVGGISIGKGFQGVLKRHNFRSKPQTHGCHEFYRHGGSIGMATTPGKVFKGKKMPGQMGNEKVTVQNLEVVAIEADQNIILIRGGLPGSKNSYVYIKGSVKGGFAERDLIAAPAAPAEEAPAAEASAE